MLVKTIFLTFLTTILISNTGCNLSFKTKNVAITKHKITAAEARSIITESKVAKRSMFMDRLLSEIIPSVAGTGRTRIFLLDMQYYDDFFPLNAEDAATLVKYGYKVKMSSDDKDVIEYVDWN